MLEVVGEASPKEAQMAAKLVLDGLLNARPSQERDFLGKFNVVCVYDVGFGPEEIEAKDMGSSELPVVQARCEAINALAATFQEV